MREKLQKVSVVGTESAENKKFVGETPNRANRSLKWYKLGIVARRNIWKYEEKNMQMCVKRKIKAKEEQDKKNKKKETNGNMEVHQ